MLAEQYPTLEKDPAESLDYAVEFDRHCVRLREPNTDYSINTRVRPARATGLQYTATVAGRSGTDEPRWPTTVGGTVQDGSITWTAEAVSVASLLRSLNTATWTADTGVTVATPTTTTTRASALISGGQLGQKYLVRCDGTFSDGTIRSAAFWLSIVRPRTVVA
jgi:hypothetical protein